MTKEAAMLRDELVPASIKGGLGLLGSIVSSLTLNDWVAILTIVYLALQIFLLIPKYRDWWRARKSPQNRKRRTSDKEEA